MVWTTTISNAQVSWTHFYNRDGPNPTTETGWSQGVKTVNSVFTPPRIRRPKPKDLFTNATPWFRASSLTSYSEGELYVEHASNWSTKTVGPVSWHAQVVLPPLEDILNSPDFGRADLKMRLKIRDGKVDLYSSFAELGQTSDMMFGLFQDLTSAVKRFKSGQSISTLVRTLQAPRDRNERRVANRWLEYQYGVIPTLNDIYGLAEAAVTRANEGIPHYAEVRVTDEETTHVGAGLVTGLARVKTRKTVKTRYEIKNGSLAKATQLGLTNPVASAYNLIPWSFVVDWAFSIGDFLEGFDALLGVDNLYVQRGVGRDIVVQQKVQGVQSEDPWPIRYSSRERRRLPLATDLSFGSPRIHNPFGTVNWKTRVANATALLQQFRR